MRIPVSVVLVCFALTAAAPADSLPSGTWEGVMRSPRRPVVVRVNFDSHQAWADIAGTAPLPLPDATASDGHVRFELPVFDPHLAFDGMLREGEITGSATLAESSFPFSLRRLPDLPKPRDRVEAWQQDIDAAIDRFLAYDRSFSDSARQSFRRELTVLRSSVANKSDAEVMAGLSRAVALAGNTHTRLYMVRNRTEVRRYPIRYWWFGNQLRIVRATAEYKTLLGCRVERIAGAAASAVQERVAELFAGNPSWHRYVGVAYMNSPEVLEGLRLVAKADPLRLDLADCAAAGTASVAALPLQKRTAPLEPWWELAPEAPVFGGASLNALPAGRVPLYLRNPGRNYWFEYLPEHRAIYFSFMRAQEDPAEPIDAFRERLLAALRDKPTGLVIVDLRFNTGGDLGIGRALMERLQASAGALRVYCITGRATFSAGLFHAVQWKSWGRATFVGEPVGDVLDFWSEGGNVPLPNSGLMLHYGNGFHRYSRRDYPQNKPYFAEMSVDTPAPDLPATSTWRQYLAGEDPALDAIWKAESRRSER